MDAYYRQSLSQLGHTDDERNARRDFTGRYHKAPPVGRAPIAEVREDMARWSAYAGKHTPKEVADRSEADRKHGGWVYEMANSLALWTRLGEPRPMPPGHPRGPLDGFDDDAIALGKRGRDIARIGWICSKKRHIICGGHTCGSRRRSRRRRSSRRSRRKRRRSRRRSPGLVLTSNLCISSTAMLSDRILTDEAPRMQQYNAHMTTPQPRDPLKGERETADSRMGIPKWEGQEQRETTGGRR